MSRLDDDLDFGFSDRPPRSPMDDVADNTDRSLRTLYKVHDELGSLSVALSERDRQAWDDYRRPQLQRLRSIEGLLTQIRFLLVVLVLALLFFASQSRAAPRSAAARADFQRANPCPVTGAARGPCKGYVVDHVVPLCAGGADHRSNMQWQTVEAAKVKDRAEVAQCRRAR